LEPRYLELSTAQVGLATLLILVSGAISVGFGLGIERRLLWAALRCVVQLLLVGLVLEAVFAASRRAQFSYPGIVLTSVISIGASAWLMTGLALAAIITPDPWYEPRYAIPLIGMILGNTLNGISIGLDRLGGELTSRRDEVEARLALGADRWEAALPLVRQAIRAGMIPILNAMMVAGIVSLPGMMTGQLLAGADPIEAVKYQIVIMFLIGAGTSLGTIGVVLLSHRRLFSADHQFLSERLCPRY